MTGKEMPKLGDPPACQFPESPDSSMLSWDSVFLWSHQSYDGAGHGADHFSFLCQEIFQWLISCLVHVSIQ